MQAVYGILSSAAELLLFAIGAAILLLAATIAV